MSGNSGSRSGAMGQSERTRQGYSTTAKSMHWLIALLLIAQFVVAILMPDIGPKTVPGTLINLHLSLGVLILVLMAARFIYRQLYPVALEMTDSPAWERWIARATHRAFYFILLIAPFLGWASASAHRFPIDVFGIVSLPAIAAPKASWALTAGDVHGYLMWMLLGLMALHAAAALYHYFFRHDGVLQRMLPAGRK